MYINRSINRSIDQLVAGRRRIYVVMRADCLQQMMEGRSCQQQQQQQQQQHRDDDDDDDDNNEKK